MDGMRHSPFLAVPAVGIAVLAGLAISQEMPTSDQNGSAQQKPYQNMTTEQRTAATRAFLGLGPEPEQAAAKRGEPLFRRSCAFCHGAQARGGTGSNLITSDEVLGDDHGEHLVPFLKKGQPENGMPAFASMSDDQLRDITEFLHLLVEDVANRGTYHVLNILVGNAAEGKAYVTGHCMSCHTTKTFAHIANQFRSAEQLQRGWIWPTRNVDSSLSVTATVKTSDGRVTVGRVTQVSDFRITLVDSVGQMHVIDLKPGIEVQINDPLKAHQDLIMSLTNSDMHNVTAYLETLH
jgi:cytochrome c oxidase cbb3-type subunit 3